MVPRLDQVLGLAAALVRGGQRREAAVAQLLRPDNLFQPFTTTSAGRYPEEFAVVRESLPAGAPAVLSFGCASGDELFSVRADFPEARVHGIDINPLAVRTARRRIRAANDDRITVERAADASGLAPSSYDVVLALAVFRHGALKALPPSCAHLIRFADFERTVTGLCAALRPGGLFVVRHANFRFTDCAVAGGFEPVRAGFPSSNEGGTTPVYDRDDRLVPGAAGDDGVYRKITP
jgi:SAM-dependent methyltransferase